MIDRFDPTPAATVGASTEYHAKARSAPTSHSMHNADELIPPDWLASQAGPGSFPEIGRELARCLVELGGLERDSHVLDVGCGSGRLAVPLTAYLSPDGKYEGLDVLPWAIDWCQKEVSSRYPNFSFQHADVFSAQYYPDGPVQPQDYTLPYGRDQFDVVCATSLFTHMRSDGLERYLSEIARVLTGGGRALMTFYLLNDESLRSIETGTLGPEFRFEHSLGECWVTYEDAPEYIVGYSDEFVLEACRRAGLLVKEPIFYGQWCGREKFLSWQDVIVADLPGSLQAVSTTSSAPSQKPAQ
jgi:SAM-dependent methyltransferase